MEPNTAKYIAMALLVVVSFFLGFLPLKIGKYFLHTDSTWKNTLTSILLCFGGGVLFATSFIHILPEVRENIEEWVELSGVDLGHASEKFSEIILCAGFFLIYFVEEAVHAFLDSGIHHHQSETMQIHRSFSIHSQACEAGTDVEKSTDFIVAPDSTTSNYKTFDDQDSKPSKGKLKVTSSDLRDFFTVLALSFHAVFEGLAVGLEEDYQGVWLLFAAVAAHKYVISFCLGVELYAVRTRLTIYILYMTVWVVMSPIGIAIGILITNHAEQGSGYYLAVGVLQALAGGTIIYVVVFEVLERERSKKVSGLAQLLFFVLGFCALMLIELLAGHDHSHEHEHDHDHTNVTTMGPTTVLV